MRLRLPLARLISVLLFAALCALCAAWALKLLAPRSPIAPSAPVAAAPGGINLKAPAQLFGQAPVAARSTANAPVAPANVQVVGVLAAGPRGIALLAVDGRPAKPFAVGDTLVDGSVVRSVGTDSVKLERNGVTLSAPSPGRASLSVLTSGPAAAPAPDGSPPAGSPGPGASAPPTPLPPRGLASSAQSALPGSSARPIMPPAPPVAPGQPLAPGAFPGGSPQAPGMPPQGVPQDPNLLPPGVQPGLNPLQSSGG